MRFDLLVFVIVLLLVQTTGKPRKKVNHPPCPPELLWKMILTAGMGDASSSHLLPSTLFILGFRRTGIHKSSLASAWQSKLPTLKSGSVFSQFQAQGSRFAEEPLCHQNHPLSCLNSSGNASLTFEQLLQRLLNLTDNSTSVNDDGNSPIEIKWKQKGRKSSSMIVSISDIRIKFPISRKRGQKKMREEAKRNEVSSSVRHSKNSDKITTASSGNRCLEQRQRRKKGLVNSDGLLIEGVKELIEVGICKEPNNAFTLALKTIDENYKLHIKKTKC